MLAPNGTADVVIVGFGPVGAALAGLLGQRGVNVLVLERESDVFALPRAAHVDHTGLRTWQELGLLDKLLPQMQANAGLEFLTRDNELLARIPGEGLSPSGLPFSMYFFQPDLDRAVRDQVSAMPSVSVRLGTNVTQVTRVEDRVVIDAVTGNQSVRLAAQWAVACDGASSGIREAMGGTVEDLRFDEPWLVVDLVFTGSEGSPLASAICKCDPDRPTYSIPMPKRRHRFEFRLMPQDDPANITSRESVEALVSPWLPHRNFEIERRAIYTFHGLVADRWRDGRILLAGDAAHQMPPFLGQGMCSGLRDAANLAWKLGLVVSGAAPTRLLDTYQEERRTHVRAIVDAAVSIGRVICTVDPAEAAQRDAQMLADSRPPTQRITFTLPPLQAGSLTLADGGDIFIQPEADGRRFDDVIGQRFAVLARSHDLIRSACAQWWQTEMGAFVASVPNLPPEAALAVRSWLDNKGCDVVVVRPDRYVMWAGTDLESATESVADLLSAGEDLALSAEAPLSLD